MRATLRRVPHHHGHAHHHDRGPAAWLRYLRLLPRMWRSEVNAAVVRELEVGPGQLVVDLGAGAGAAAVEAARRGARVLAVDPMPLMRAVLAVRRSLRRRAGDIAIRDGAAESIPAGDGTASALWSVNTLHHWTDREKASRELARVLEPGGRVLLLDEDFHDDHHPEHRHGRKHPHGLRFDDVDPGALARLLLEAGFRQAEGGRGEIAGRPALVVRATR